MIDLALVQAELNSVTTRVTTRYEAEEWATGQFDRPPYDLLPTIPANASAAAKRLAGMAQPMGPRIVGVKKHLTLGDVNWGGDNPGNIDGRLDALDLADLADELLEAGLISGFPCGIVRRPLTGETDDGEPLSGDPVIEPLLGHTEPLFDAESPNRIAGIFQAWRPLDAREKGWRVRIYDFDLRTMTEWRELEQPYMVGRRPVAQIQNAPMPRYQVFRRGRGRMPIGDMELALPLLKSDWSSQVRGDRAEENTAFSQLVISGSIDTDDDRGAGLIIRTEQDGDAKYLTPGDLSQIHAHHDRKIERLKRDLSLPGGVLSGSNVSGEALREDNAHAIADARAKARKIERLLTDLVADYAAEVGVGNPPQVSVSINKEYEAAQNVERVVMLYREGLVEHAAAVRTVSAYVPVWKDEEIEAFIEEERNAVPPVVTPPDLAEATE